jgi:hypothetical protein
MRYATAKSLTALLVLPVAAFPQTASVPYDSPVSASEKLSQQGYTTVAGAESELYIRTMRMRRTHQSSSKQVFGTKNADAFLSCLISDEIRYPQERHQLHEFLIKREKVP